MDSGALSLEVPPQLMVGGDVDLVCANLKTNSVLEELNIMSNTIGPRGARSLAEALKLNASL